MFLKQPGIRGFHGVGIGSFRVLAASLCDFFRVGVLA